MKKRVLLISAAAVLLLVVAGAVYTLTQKKENKEVTTLTDHSCKKTPLSDTCLKIADGPVYDDTIHFGTETVFTEDFSQDYLNSMPFSWLLYRSDTYKLGAVDAKVREGENGNKYVSLYSNGVQGPLYNPTDRSLIFTREFNLDEKGFGVAEADIMIPGTENNEVYFEVATGAVNVLGINIKKDGKLSVISGGVYFNYQGTVDVTNTGIILSKDKWYRFRLEWNRSQDFVKASMYDDGGNLVNLYESSFHISVRDNAKNDGTPLVPNIIRFTMPKMADRIGYAYIDNIRVDSVIESGE